MDSVSSRGRANLHANNLIKRTNFDRSYNTTHIYNRLRNNRKRTLKVLNLKTKHWTYTHIRDKYVCISIAAAAVAAIAQQNNIVEEKAQLIAFPFDQYSTWITVYV